MLVVSILLAFLAGSYHRQETIDVDPGKVASELGQGFIYPLPRPGWGLTFLGDNNDSPHRSSMRIYEDGIALGPGHSLHQDIRDHGGGRFSHWKNYLLFSSSDGSDPRSGRHVYRIEADSVVLPPVVYLILGLGILFSALNPAVGAYRAARAYGFKPAVRATTRILWNIQYRLRISDRAFHAAFAVILGAGLLLRVFYIRVLDLPFLAPDSLSYLSPALTDPILPFSQARTIGIPGLISLGLALSGDLKGVWILHTGLWATSVPIFIYGLSRATGLKAAALVVLAYATFTQKFLAFEFFVLSEHAGRAFYMMSAGLLLICIRSRSIIPPILLGLALVVGILIKPTSLSALPVVALVFLLKGLAWKDMRRAAATGALATGLVVAGGIAGYMGAFKARYGDFAFSYFDGPNFYSQVAHLTDLRGSSRYPELKRELAEILPAYKEQFAARGDLQWNWIIYSAMNPDLERVFGDRAPAKIITKYSDGTSRGINALYRELAIEAMLANPGEYLRLSLQMTWRMFREGYNFYYDDYFNPRTFERVRANEELLRVWLSGPYGLDRYPRGRMLAEKIPHTADPPGAPSPLATAAFNIAAKGVFGATDLFRNILARGIVLGSVAILAVIAVSVAALMMKAVHFRLGRIALWGGVVRIQVEAAIGAVAIGGIAAAYLAGMGFICASDPIRFMVNVQDLVTAFLMLMIFSIPPLLRRLTGTILMGIRR